MSFQSNKTTTIISQRPLNKMQIDTAETLLNKAITDKKAEIADKAFKADIIKYTKIMNEFNKKAVELKNFAFKIKAEIEKNPKLTVNVGNYNGLAEDLPQSIEEAERKSVIEVKSTGWNEPTPYEPDLSKEEREVTLFILNLKLGTALMSDLQILLDKIEKIK